MILCIGTTPAAQRVMVFPRLALDEVNRAVITLDGAAGKSVNVAKVLKALGEEPLATGFLGGDRGESIKRLLRDRRIKFEFVAVAQRTRECITVIDQARSEQTELVEESSPVAASDYKKLLSVIGKRVKECRAVVMSGTITPGGPKDFYYQCTSLARDAGALSVADAKGAPLFKLLEARPGLVKPNRSELAASLGRELGTERALRSGIHELHELGAERVVITAGKSPALAFDGRRFWKIDAPRIKAVNPIGSGDSFTAALVWRLLRGDDLGEACRWAAAAGAANALTLMAGEVEVKDLRRLYRQTKVERA